MIENHKFVLTPVSFNAPAWGDTLNALFEFRDELDDKVKTRVLIRALRW